MSRGMAWGLAIALGAFAGCTVLFPVEEAPPVPEGPLDEDGRADAAPAVDTCGTIVRTLDLAGPAIGVSWEGDRLFAAWEGGGVDQIDIGDGKEPGPPDSLQLAGPTALDGAPCPACPEDIDGRRAGNVLVSCAEGLELLATDPRLHVIARLSRGGALDTSVSGGGHRAVASFEDGLVSVLSLSDLLPGGDVVALEGRERVLEPPCAPRAVATTRTRWGAALIDGDGCAGPSLYVFPLSGSGLPAILALDGEPQDLVAIDDDGLLVALGEAGLVTVALGDTLTLRAVPGIAEARALTTFGHFAFVAGASGVQVVDLADPLGPRGVGQVDLPAAPLGLATSGGALYVALGDGGVAVVDTDCFVVEGEGDPGRDGLGGEGEGEGEPPPEGPTSCEPARAAVLSIDGRLRCEPGCLTVELGDAIWCTTECGRDAECGDTSDYRCDLDPGHCVRRCKSDADCRAAGLHRCDLGGGSCL